MKSKPITDATAKRMAGSAERHRYRADLINYCAFDVEHLLADRKVAMEMIKALHVSLLHAPPPEKAPSMFP